MCRSTQECQRVKVVQKLKHVRSGACEEGYAAISAGCKGGERDGTWPLKQLCCQVGRSKK